MGALAHSIQPATTGATEEGALKIPSLEEQVGVFLGMNILRHLLMDEDALRKYAKRLMDMTKDEGGCLLIPRLTPVTAGRVFQTNENPPETEPIQEFRSRIRVYGIVEPNICGSKPTACIAIEGLMMAKYWPLPQKGIRCGASLYSPVVYQNGDLLGIDTRGGSGGNACCLRRAIIE